LWAHERLMLRCPAPSCETLDQLDAVGVLALPAPPRATTILDFERIARDVPGTRVQRARAWAEIDPAVPGAKASGTVTVVIVPELPTGRPSPTAGLLRAVRAYLDRRRVLCTRLVLVGPQYVVVSVSAAVRATSGADTSRVASDVRAALDGFFDPLTGGPAGRGWPFGRDVFRSEVLALVDSVRGVDHVLELTLGADTGDPTCDNVCVAPTRLVASGTHTIQVHAT
jgi:predicted phage baseplate assembly protein